MSKQRKQLEANYRFIMAHRDLVTWRTAAMARLMYAMGSSLLWLQGKITPTHRKGE